VIDVCIMQFIHPPAAGGGTPEVMAFLNGIIVHGSLSLKNLVVKFTANVFAVSSGLPAAIQAPIITYGSVGLHKVGNLAIVKRRDRQTDKGENINLLFQLSSIVMPSNHSSSLTGLLYAATLYSIF